MWTAIPIAAAILAASAIEVRVETIDGATHDGPLAAWSDEALQLADAEPLATADVVRLDVVRGTQPQQPPGESARITLIDQSTLAIDSFESIDETASLSCRQFAEELNLPIAQVAAVRFVDSNPELDAIIAEVRDEGLAADILIAGNGTSYEQYAGVVGDITGTAVRFKLDDDWLDVRRTKVAAILFFRRPAPRAKGFELRGEQFTLHIRHVEMAGDTLRVETASGLELDIAIDQIQAADYARGKLTFLSDLTPVRAQHQPFSPLPPAAALARKSVQHRTNVGFWDAKPTLRHAIRRDERIVGWRRTQYERGIALRSGTEIEFRLPEGNRKLTAIAGIDADIPRPASLELEILLDGESVLREKIAADDDPHLLHIDLKRARRLTIVAHYGEQGDPGDRLYLCEPRLIP